MLSSLCLLSLGASTYAFNGFQVAHSTLQTSQAYLSRCSSTSLRQRASCGALRMGSELPFEQDLHRLNQRIKKSVKTTLTVQDLPNAMAKAYVLIFNPGTEQEGVYTLQYEEDTCILVFEAPDEAARFAGLLEAEDFDLPQAIEWPKKQIDEFCTFSKIKLGLVPCGSHLMPPEHNVYEDGLQTEDSVAPRIAQEVSWAQTEDLDSVRSRLDALFNRPEEGI